MTNKKDKILAPIKSRIVQYLENQGIEKKSFFEKIKSSSSNFRGNALFSEVSSDVVAKILSLNPNISAEWLIIGKGEMLKIDNKKELIPSTDGLPLIPIDAMAGFGSGSAQIMDYETSRYIVPEFEELKADFMIRVKGSSMYPKYNSGDLLACKKLPLDTFFQWNKVYVLDTSQGALVKRVKKSDLKGHIYIVSDNKSYDSFNLHLDEVNSLALVVGVIRLE